LGHESEQRIEVERRREEQRRHTELVLRQQEEQLLRRDTQDLGQLRRQENELRQQANALQQLLDRQEAALRQMGGQDIQPQLDLNGHSLAAFSNVANQALAPPPVPQSPSAQYSVPLAHQMRTQAPPQQQYMGRASQPMQNYNYKRNRRF